MAEMAQGYRVRLIWGCSLDYTRRRPWHHNRRVSVDYCHYTGRHSGSPHQRIGYSDDSRRALRSVVVAKIRTTHTKFDLKTEAVVAMKQARVSDIIIEASVA